MSGLLGVIVNPIAGMGGRVGLKGTDGSEALRQALKLGARPEAPARVTRALQQVKALAPETRILTCPGSMGENVVRDAGFKAEVLELCAGSKTRPEDTEEAAREMIRRGVDLLMFGGGDGTARNILDAVDGSVPVVGVPAGVKMHSAVFATDPRAAGDLAASFLLGEIQTVRDSEVMDIDEEAFRQGRVSARLYGYLRVPESPMMQGLKSGSTESEQAVLEGMAEYVAELMDDEPFYIIGPGTTTRAIMNHLHLEYSLLGVDVVRGGELILKDANESNLIRVLENGPAHIIVTPIGGQGYIFGRGNQQISSSVIRAVGREKIWVVATKGKILSQEGRPFLVDTGDHEVDELLRGYVRVIMDYRQETVHQVR